MKRFLSLMLSVMMVLTAFGTLTFAVSAEGTITLTPEIAITADDVLKTGEKVAFISASPEGTTVKYYNNGSEITPTAVSTETADGTTTAKVAVTLNTGKNVISAKAFNGISELAESASYTVNAVEYVQTHSYADQAALISAHNTAISGTTTAETLDGKSAILTTTGNRLFHGCAYGGDSDVKVVEMAYSIYFKALPESAVRLHSIYHRDNDDKEKTGLNSIFQVDTDGHLIYSNSDNAVSEAARNKDFYFTTDKWYDVKVYFNKEADTVDLYIDDMIVVKDHNVFVDNTNVLSTFRSVSCVWVGANKYYTADFSIKGYNAFDMTALTPTDAFPAGSKVGVYAANLPAGASVVGVKNGASSTLTSSNGIYSVVADEGYSEIEIKVVDANGNTVYGVDGKPATTGSKLYYGYGLNTAVTAEENVLTDDDFSGTSAKPVTKTGRPADTEEYATDKQAAYDSYYNTDEVDGQPAPSMKLVHTGNKMGYMKGESTVTINSYENNAGTTYANNNVGQKYIDGRAEYSLDFKFADTISEMADATGAVVKMYRTANGTRNQISLIKLRKADGVLYVPIYAADGSTETDTLVLTGVDPTEWHNYKMVVEPSKNKMYVYVDGVLYVDTALSVAGNITQIESMRFQPPRVYYGKTSTKSMTMWCDNVKAVYYTQNYVSTKSEASIAIGTPSGNLLSGTKIKVTVSGMRYGQSAAAYVNGKKTVLGTENGVYYVDVPASYSVISAAVLASDGSIAKDTAENEIKTADFTYYAFTLKDGNEQTVVVDDNFEADAVKPADMPSAPAEDDKYPEGYHQTLTEIYNFNIQEKSTGGNDGAYVQIQHAYDNMRYYTIKKVNDQNVVGDDGKYALNDSLTTQNSYEVTAGPVQNSYTGAIVYRADIKFEDNYADAADYGSGASFIAIPAGGSTTARSWYYPFGYKKDSATNKGVLITTSYKNGVKETSSHSDIDITEWHTYGLVIQPSINQVWFLVDGVVVDSGNYLPVADETITKLESIKAFSPRTNASGKHIVMAVDNVYYETNSLGYENARTTEAFVNISANGVGLVPANLESGNKVADMAIIAKAADGSVEIQSYNAESTTDTYKYFEFAKPAVKVYVWEWGTLKPLYAPVYSSVE